jgi:hypothetical protein
MNSRVIVPVILAVLLIGGGVILSGMYRQPSQSPLPGPKHPPEVTPDESAFPTITTLSSPTISGPPSFTLLVTPVEVRAGPGDTILYTLTIEPEGGFSQPVSLRLEVSALFLYRNSFDLGSVNPPYPRTFEYLFRVPQDVPAGVTVKGILTAEGGGHTEERDLILLVGK